MYFVSEFLAFVRSFEFFHHTTFHDPIGLLLPSIRFSEKSPRLANRLTILTSDPEM